MNNFIDLGPCSLGRRRLMIYLDTKEYLGAGPLVQRKVNVKHASDLVRDGEPYRLVILKVLKKDLDGFKEAMEDLKNKMLICGHRDYESHGGDMIEEVLTLMREDMQAKGWIDSPLGGRIRPKLG